MNQNIFKAYDIRGIYPTELNEAAALATGRAVAKIVNGGRVVVGRDMRLSSLSLHQALIRGLIAGGAKVEDIELASIDAVYFAVGRYEYDAGIMVTASHNPPEYNGFKIVKKGVEIVRGQDIKKIMDGDLVEPANSGSLRQVNLWSEYINYLKSFVNLSALRSLKVVVDAGNGMAGLVIPRLMTGLPFEVEPLFFELDGSFPNRPSNPLADGATRAVTEKIIQVKANLGIIFDGDTDRVFFIDETGRFVPADITLILLAKEFLRREPGSAIVYNLICSRAVPEFITKWGGRPIRSAVGYVNMRTSMIANQAIFGGELSAHYSFRDTYYADSGFVAVLLVLELLSRQNQPLSELIKAYSPYVKSPETNLTVKDPPMILAELKKHYADSQIDELDGVTVSHPNWWFNARPSNTEPLLRVVVEANNQQLMEVKLKEIVDFIKSLSR
ncbi:MAG: phosphomannomutase/phosphoglucomutase [Patescibacteria group bacterium]